MIHNLKVQHENNGKAWLCPIIPFHKSFFKVKTQMTGQIQTARLTGLNPPAISQVGTLTASIFAPRI